MTICNNCLHARSAHGVAAKERCRMAGCSCHKYKAKLGRPRTELNPTAVVEETIYDIVQRLKPFVGCGDNGCLFVPPIGAGTNRGCRCVGGVGMKPGMIPALAALYRAATQLDRERRAPEKKS